MHKLLAFASARPDAPWTQYPEPRKYRTGLRRSSSIFDSGKSKAIHLTIRFDWNRAASGKRNWVSRENIFAHFGVETPRTEIVAMEGRGCVYIDTRICRFISVVAVYARDRGGESVVGLPDFSRVVCRSVGGNLQLRKLLSPK